jgi:DNA polymerase III subunit beta
MKITVSKKAISAALQHCCAAAQRNSTMPILKCVQLVPSADGFTLAAQNEGRRMAVTCTVKAQVSQPESLCVSAHDFFDRIKALPDGDIKIVSKSGKLSLEAGNRKLGLSYLSADDYPKVPSQTGDTIAVPASLLFSALKGTAFAICDDYSRGSLHGVRWTFAGGAFTSVATDGRRIAAFGSDGPQGALTVVIPQYAALMLRSVLEGAAGDAIISHDSTTFHLAMGDVSFACVTFASEQFPPVENFLSVAPKNECKVMTQVALDSLKAMQACSAKLGQLTVQKAKWNIRIVAVSEGGDESTDEFMAEGGEDFEPIRVSAAYLIDAIGATGTETCMIDATGESFEPVRVSGGKTKHIVMPVVTSA